MEKTFQIVLAAQATLALGFASLASAGLQVAPPCSCLVKSTNSNQKISCPLTDKDAKAAAGQDTASMPPGDPIEVDYAAGVSFSCTDTNSVEVPAASYGAGSLICTATGAHCGYQYYNYDQAGGSPGLQHASAPTGCQDFSIDPMPSSQDPNCSAQASKESDDLCDQSNPFYNPKLAQQQGCSSAPGSSFNVASSVQTQSPNPSGGSGASANTDAQ